MLSKKKGHADSEVASYYIRRGHALSAVTSAGAGSLSASASAAGPQAAVVVVSSQPEWHLVVVARPTPISVVT